MPSVDSAQALRDIKGLFRDARRTSHDPDALDEEAARALLREMRGAEGPADVGGVLERASELLEGHGVEELWDDDVRLDYYENIIFLYVNMGDPYVQTIGYDTAKGAFVMASWGDWLEQHEREKAEESELGRAIERQAYGLDEEGREPEYNDDDE